ncbi:MAG: type II secretion system protein GspL [Thermodesulfobacteriota bacterium]
MGAGSVRGLRLVRTADGFEIDGTVSAEFRPDRPPDPAELAGAVIGVTGPLLDEKTRLVAGLDPRQAGLHLMNLPFDSPDKMQRALKYEAEPLFLTPVDELVLDYLALPPDGEGGRPGVVFGAPPGAVAAVLENLALAHEDPTAVLPDRLGLLAAGRWLFADRPGPARRLLLDLGAGQTGLGLFDEGRPVLIRSVFYGGADLTRALIRELDLAPDQAEKLKRATDMSSGEESGPAGILAAAWEPLLVEMRRTLAAAGPWPEGEPPLVVLAGGGALAPGLADFLTGRLGLPAASATDRFPGDPRPPALSPDFVLPLGLAQLGLTEGRQPNLRQGDLAPRRILARHRRALTLLAAGLALALVFSGGDFFYRYRVQVRKYQAIKSEITRVFREAVPGVTAVVDPVAQMKQEIEKARASAAGLDRGGRVLDLLLEVSRVAGAHASLRVTDLTLSPERLEITGEGGSFELADQLKTELGRLPFFSEAVLGGARMDPNTKVLNFKISLKRKSE